MEKKRSSHLRAGLIAGAIIGLASGLFLQSRKGKQLTSTAQKKAMILQKQVMKKLKSSSTMSKASYEDIVDTVLAYYKKSKEIAAKEVPQVRAFLMSQWKEVQKAIKE